MSRHPTTPPWHCLTPDEVARRRETSLARGLAPDEAARRLERHGPNQIREAKRRSVWRMLLGQFTDFMILVLIAAAAIAGAIGELADTVAILAIVVLNGLIGFIQEYRAERAMAALKKLAANSAKVMRGGVPAIVPAAALVPGDLVIIEAGDAVPADLRLVEATALKTEEAALTGESAPVEKSIAVLAEAELPLADRRNMAYKGTVATYGHGRGIVVATGMQTELGGIATLLAAGSDTRTPLQLRLERFGRSLAVAALTICVAVFAFGVARGEPWLLMLLTAVSLAVAAIPEALPAVVTIALALGAYKLVRKNALIRRLPAVETLGSVTFICSDKTGTLTQNRMRVEAVHADSAVRPLLFLAMALNNDARITLDGREIGDPTEVALLLAANARGTQPAAAQAGQPRLAELPFDSDRKLMTTFHADVEGVIAFTKGAPERVIEQCGDADSATLLAEAERMATEGLRVIAFAYRRWPAPPAMLSADEVEADLAFLGLVGMMDPPRPEAAEAVALCKSAGITPVMVTGDHPATARAIAIRLGILVERTHVMTGAELARLSPEEFAAQVRQIRVYARVDPAQKIRIVEALQAHGEFVAMTGDGVNDAPAIKRAEIGIAMGKIGTDVAREASSMVLLDDHFATIVVAVREGRRVYDNIRKFIRYVMTGNIGEIACIFAAPMFGLPLPLAPIQILWVNLVTDGLPGLALAAERAEGNVMHRAPRPPGESVFAHGLGAQIAWTGILIGMLSIGAQAWAYHAESTHWQTMAFTVLTFCQLFVALGVRSGRESLAGMGITSNLPLAGAVAFTFVLQLAIIYTPALQAVFKTQPLEVAELAFCVGVASFVLAAMELEKWLMRRGWLYRDSVPEARIT